MKELTELYAQMGISPAVYAYGEQAIARLKERFEAIDQIAEYNQENLKPTFFVYFNTTVFPSIKHGDKAAKASYRL